MRSALIFALLILMVSCSETKELPPSETAKILAESFYHSDETTLKRHTTA